MFPLNLANNPSVILHLKHETVLYLQMPPEKLTCWVRECLPLSSSLTQWLSASLCWYCALYYKGLNYYCCCYTQRCMSQCLTRSSADADKPARRVWRSVKVTKHSTIPYVRYSFLLCNSNFVFKTKFKTFWRHSTSKNVVTLKLGSEVTQGHWEWYHSIDCVWFPISVL